MHELRKMRLETALGAAPLQRDGAGRGPSNKQFASGEPLRGSLSAFLLPFSSLHTVNPHFHVPLTGVLAPKPQTRTPSVTLQSFPFRADLSGALGAGLSPLLHTGSSVASAQPHSEGGGRQGPAGVPPGCRGCEEEGEGGRALAPRKMCAPLAS